MKKIATIKRDDYILDDTFVPLAIWRNGSHNIFFVSLTPDPLLVVFLGLDSKDPCKPVEAIPTAGTAQGGHDSFLLFKDEVWTQSSTKLT